MIKNFKYKDMILAVKTTIIKDGVCYFGEKDIVGEFEKAFNAANYRPADQKSTEQMILNVYNGLLEANIKADSITFKNVVYTGIKMANFGVKEKEE